MKIFSRRGRSNFIILLILLAGVFGASADAAGNRETDNLPVGYLTLTGRWKGSWRSYDGNSAGDGSAYVIQTGTELSGKITISGVGPCHGDYTYPISGSISGSKVKFNTSGTNYACDVPVRVYFNGTLSGNEMSGSYHDEVWQLYWRFWDSGTFAVTRQVAREASIPRPRRQQ